MKRKEKKLKTGFGEFRRRVDEEEGMLIVVCVCLRLLLSSQL